MSDPLGTAGVVGFLFSVFPSQAVCVRDYNLKQSQGTHEQNQLTIQTCALYKHEIMSKEEVGHGYGGIHVWNGVP